jgi:hypothetical protein
LRDEGVLFGLSESDPNEKTDIIQKYFSNLAASHILRMSNSKMKAHPGAEPVYRPEEQPYRRTAGKAENACTAARNASITSRRTLIGITLCVGYVHRQFLPDPRVAETGI